MIEHNISKPLVSPWGQSTVPKRVSEVPRPDKAVHGRPYEHQAEPKVVQRSHHAADRKFDHVFEASTQRVDCSDIDLALLGASSADDL
jgi:hypothetical protein